MNSAVARGFPSPVLRRSFSSSAPGGDTSFASVDNSFDPMPQTSAGAAKNGKGSSAVLWIFDWAATGSGNATVDLEYFYSATVASYAAGETAKASSLVTVDLDGTQNQQESLHFFNNQNGNTSGISNLLLNFSVNTGDHGTFTVTTASNVIASLTAVPVPAAAWLLASAMAGMIGFRRSGAQSRHTLNRSPSTPAQRMSLALAAPDVNSWISARLTLSGVR